MTSESKFPLRYRLSTSTTALLAAFNVGACSEPVPNDQYNADKALFLQPEQAEAEIEQRLAKSIMVRDGLLIVRDPIMTNLDLAIMPVNAPWILHCGIGISLGFAGGSDEGGGGITIELTRAVVDKTICESLAPRLAARVERLLGRRGVR